MVPWSLITSYFSVPILYHYMHLPTESRNLFFFLVTGTYRQGRKERRGEVIIFFFFCHWPLLIRIFGSVSAYRDLCSLYWHLQRFVVFFLG
jgi:hypothetical protein